MNKCSIKLFTTVLSISFCGMNGMENQQPLSMIERKVTKRALSALVFADKEKILHVGSLYVAVHCPSIIKQKVFELQISGVGVNALNMMQESGYDKILTFACWDVVKNPKQIIDNSARLLKRHGQFCAVLPYYKSSFLDMYHQTFVSDKWKDFYNKDREIVLCGRKTIKKLLEEATLDVNSNCEIVKKPFIFKTREKFLAWIASYSGELDGVIPQERHVEFTEDVVSNYLEKYPLLQDNSVKLYLPYMIISGYKA